MAWLKFGSFTIIASLDWDLVNLCSGRSREYNIDVAFCVTL